MSKNTFSPDKVNYACCQCRVAFRQQTSTPNRVVECPQCARPMHNMGVGFVIPHRADDYQWRKIEMLVAHNFTFEILPA